MYSSSLARALHEQQEQDDDDQGAVATWIGVRYGTLNQDCGAYVSHPDGYALIVCDGHTKPITSLEEGGYGGEAAARCAVSFLVERIQQAAALDDIDLPSLFLECHNAIIQQCVQTYPGAVHTGAELNGRWYEAYVVPHPNGQSTSIVDFGTTCSVVLVNRHTQQARLAFVGDSAVYSFVPLSSASSSLSVVPRMPHEHCVKNAHEARRLQSSYSAGGQAYAQISKNKWVFPRFGQSSMMIEPTRCLGHHWGEQWGIVPEPECFTWRMQPGEVVVAASDGFWPDVPPPTLASLLKQHACQLVPTIVQCGHIICAVQRKNPNQDNALCVMSQPFAHSRSAFPSQSHPPPHYNTFVLDSPRHRVHAKAEKECRVPSVAGHGTANTTTAREEIAIPIVPRAAVGNSKSGSSTSEVEIYFQPF